MTLPHKIHDSRTIHTGRVFTLAVEDITLPGGVPSRMDVIRHPGAAAILAVDQENRVVLVRQFRHAMGDFLWEIPAGTMDPGEDPLSTARRELAEETGYTAHIWEKCGEILPVPGYSDERIHLFFATGLTKTGPQDLDADEVMDVHLFAQNHFRKMIFDGRISDAKTIAAAFKCADRFHKNPNKKT